MDLIRIIDDINGANLLYDNENLSAPIFKVTEQAVSLCFFTYTLEVNFSAKKRRLIPSRKIDLLDDGNIQLIDLTETIQVINSTLFYGNEHGGKEYSYKKMLEATLEMTNNDHSVESVLAYQKVFNEYLSSEMAQIYLNVGRDYYEYLQRIILSNTKGGEMSG